MGKRHYNFSADCETVRIPPQALSGCSISVKMSPWAALDPAASSRPELQIVDVPLPTAGRGEVRVRVLASSLEYTDVVIRRHLYPQTMPRRRHSCWAMMSLGK